MTDGFSAMNFDTTSLKLFEGHRFNGLSQVAKSINSKEFRACSFKNCDFKETEFSDCLFVDCRFEACDLSLVRFPNTAFQETTFQESKLIGVNWVAAKWDEQSLIARKFVDFQTCSLDYSIFIGLKLIGIKIRGCSAKHLDFEGTDLTAADCSDSDFEASRFVHTNLSKADFSGAVNYLIDARINTLGKTKFSLPEAISLLESLDIELVE